MSTYEDIPESWSIGYKGHRERWITGQGIQAQATWIGPWSEREEFLNIIGGTEEDIEYPGGVIANRIVPLKYPRYEDVYAESVEMEPLGRPSADPTDLMTYSKCRVTVYFASRPWYAFGSEYPLVDLQASSGKLKVTRPGTAYVFPSDSKRLAGNVGIDVGVLNFTMTFHNLGSLALETYTVLTNRVNSATFFTPYGTFAAGYVQYLGFSNQQQMSIGNNYRYTISHAFQFKERPHNQIMRPDGTAFEAPQDGNGDGLYALADLNAIYN